MDDQVHGVDSTVRLIERCRSEIAAGWQQIAAARQLLLRTRWLLDRWAAQRPVVDAQPGDCGTQSRGPDEIFVGMFVLVKPDKLRRRRGRSKASRRQSLANAASFLSA